MTFGKQVINNTLCSCLILVSRWLPIDVGQVLQVLSNQALVLSCYAHLRSGKLGMS